MLQPSGYVVDLRSVPETKGEVVNKRKPKDIVEPWPATVFIERLADCKAMLSLNGFLTEAETRRVHKRLMKFIETKKLPPLR